MVKHDLDTWQIGHGYCMPWSLTASLLEWISVRLLFIISFENFSGILLMPSESSLLTCLNFKTFHMQALTSLSKELFCMCVCRKKKNIDSILIVGNIYNSLSYLRLTIFEM